MSAKKTIAIIVLFSLSGLFGFLLSLHQESKPTQTPPIQVMETYHYPAIFVKQLEGDPAAGEKIFTEFCASCHGNPALIDVPAPRIGNKKDWESRRKLGMPLLLKFTIDGLGAMPARGGCFECSDEQLKETIHYILIHSR